MTAFGISAAVFSVVVTLFLLGLLIVVYGLKRDVERLKQRATPSHPAVASRRGVKGSAKITRQVANGLVDVDLEVS